MLCLLLAWVCNVAWGQTTYYKPGARTTTLEAGKQYFISAATFYNNGRPNLLYNNAGTLAYSDKKPNALIADETYLFTVEKIGANNIYYITNNNGKYLQANNLASADAETGITVVPYSSVKGSMTCGSDVQACDETGNKIEYNNITDATPIVCVYQNNSTGWRHINDLEIGKSTPFAFYKAEKVSPQLSVGDDTKYYSIKNVRCNEYAIYAGDGTQIQLQPYCCEAGKFYFTGEVNDEGTLLKVKIHNAATTKLCDGVSSWTESGRDWYIQVSGNSDKPGYAISSANDLTNNGYSWNDASGANKVVGTWNGNDPGSTWVFLPYEEANLCELPEMSTTASPELYYIRNARQNGSYATFVSEGQTIAQRSRVELGSYWYFVEDKNATPQDGWVACKIYNAGNGTSIKTPGGTFADQTYYIRKYVHAGLVGFTIKRSVGNDWDAWNDSNGSTVVDYKYDDAGSVWWIEPSAKNLATLKNEAAAAKTNALNTIGGYEFADYYTYSDEAIAAAKAIIDAANTADVTATISGHMSIEPALATLRSTSKGTEGPKAGDYIRIKNKEGRGYMKHVTGETRILGTNDAAEIASNVTLWAVESAGDESTNVKLRNVATGKYLGELRNGSNAKVTDVNGSDVNGHNKFAWTNINDCYAVFKDDSGGDGAYAHMGNNNPKILIGYNTGDAASHWLVEQVTAMDALAELQALIDNTNKRFGTSVGLHPKTEALEEALEAAKDWIAANPTDVEAILSEKKALQEVVNAAPTTTINTPATGKYYRLKNKSSNNYMSGNETKISLLADGADAVSTIFYLGEDKSLRSFVSGKYLDCSAKGYSDVAKSGAFGVAYNGSEANVITYMNNGFWTYGAAGDGGNLDRGSDTPNHIGYNWYVIEVDMTSVIDELNALATDATAAASLEYLSDDEKTAFTTAATTMADAATTLTNGGFVKDMTAEMEALDASIDAAMNVMSRFDLTTHPFRLKQTASGLYMVASNLAKIASKSNDATNQAFNLEATGTAGVFNLKSVGGLYMQVDEYDYLASAEGEAAKKVHEIEYIGRGKYNIKTASGYVASDEIAEDSYLWSNKTKDNANGIWELEPLTKSTVTYTLTDKVGNEYTGTYDKYEGISNSGPTFTGLEYTLTNEEWNDNNLTATIEFSGLTFPISKPGEENWTFMKTEEMSEGVAYFYANLTANKVVTKSTKSDNGKSYLPVANDDEIKKWQWAIYPAIENGKIVFTIKNRAADKFLGKENINFVTEGASFYWTACIGDGYGFSSVDNSKFFSANSSAAGEKDATLWGKTGSTHKGANLEFFTMAYTKATDAAGYTTLYTPIAVTVPSGVNAFSAELNGDNTKLVLDEVERVIPANTAVLLKGAASTAYIFSATDAETDKVENNILEGATSSTEVAEGMYILQSAEGAPSFVKATEAVPGYDAYIMVQDGPESIGIDTSIFEAVANAATANANMDIYGLQRYYGLVQEADKYECNYPSNPADGQGYPGLIDGNYETYFHSGYDGHNPSPSGVAHYLQASLNKPVKNFRFYYKKRKQNNANRPTKITIEGSNNKDQWFEVKVIDQGLPTDANVLDYYSEVISSETAYQYLRFTVNTTGGGTAFFTFSEFYILPTYAKVNEAFDAVRNYRASATIKTAVALNKAYAWNTGLTKGTPIVGADHFFFADTRQSDGSYVARYLYNNNGALATSTSLNAKDAKFIWTAAQPEGTEYFTLQNKGDATKYISYGNNGNGWWVGTTAVQLDIKSSYAVHTGSVGIQRVRPSGDNNGAWMVTAADGTSFNRNGSKENNGSWCSDYMFIPADLYEGLNTLTIVSNTSKADAVFAWDIYEAAAGSSILFSVADEITDGTLRVKSCNPAYKLEGFYSDAAYTQKITALDELTSDKTVYAKFVLDIFCESYGDKWVNIVRKTDANHAIILGSADEGTIPTFNTFNYTNKGIVWCFVGSAESFKMYNMVSGNALALTPNASPADGVAVKMVSAADATSWHLIEKGEAFAIAPVDNNDWGINSYTGTAGSQIKFYGVNDGGTQWYFTAIDASKPLTFSVAVTGEQPYATNTRVANLNTIVNGATSCTVVKGDVDALTYYLPVGATFTLNNSLTYRGYEFNGFLDAEGNAAEYTNAIIPEGGLNITASYSVDENNKYQYLFYYRDDVHNKPYRIPAIATASNNTVLAFSDYRPCSNDIGYGEVDIVLRRSYDNGETWSDAVCIADGQGGNQNVFNVGFGDAAVVADRESGKVLVMAVAGKQVYSYGSADSHNSMAKIVSNDNGENWEDPVDVTAQFFGEGSLLPDAYTMFFGSGRILQSRVYKKEGAKYYRIYGALLVKHANNDYTGDANFVVYSDDFGDSWNILGGSVAGGMCCNGGNEPKVEELPDGSIVLSSRKYNGRYFNVFTYTDKATGAGSWGSAVASHGQTGGISFGGNATNGEIYKVKAIRESDGKICDVMLQSIPTGGGRSNVSVYFKEMSYAETYAPTTFAQNWTKGLEVSAMGSAYSTMTLQADGNFGFFYEEEPGDQWAYCMVYVPLSLEEITNGAYRLYTVNSTISKYGVGTFYASEAMQIPAGVQAYVADKGLVMEGEEGNKTGVLTLTELKEIIPANTGAVILAEQGDYTFIPSISYGRPVEGNMLVGYEADNTGTDLYREESLADGYTTYVLTVKNEQAGFYRKDKKFNVNNNKAYLQVPATLSAQSIRLRLDGSTDIEPSTLNPQPMTETYDLMGRRVEKMEKGIYIMNGRKVIVK